MEFYNSTEKSMRNRQTGKKPRALGACSCARLSESPSSHLLETGHNRLLHRCCWLLLLPDLSLTLAAPYEDTILSLSPFTSLPVRTILSHCPSFAWNCCKLQALPHFAGFSSVLSSLLLRQRPARSSIFSSPLPRYTLVLLSSRIFPC